MELPFEMKDEIKHLEVVYRRCKKWSTIQRRSLADYPWRAARKVFLLKKPRLAAYLEPVEELLDGLERYNIPHISYTEDLKSNHLVE